MTKLRGTPVKTPAELDHTAAVVMSEMGLDDEEHAHKGATLLSALLHEMPELQGQLPISRRSLRGWWRHCGGKRERHPMSRRAVGAVAATFALEGRVQELAITVLTFDALLRCEDWRKLRAVDICCDAGEVALRLGVPERGERTKTGTEQGVTLWSRVAKVLAEGLKLAAPFEGARVFTVTEQEFRISLAETLGELGVPPPPGDLEFTPHCLRHAGASVAFQEGVPLREIKLRGRWVADSSVRRYTKPHLLVRLDESLPRDTHRLGEVFWDDPLRFVRTAIQQQATARLVDLF